MTDFFDEYMQFKGYLKALFQVTRMAEHSESTDVSLEFKNEIEKLIKIKKNEYLDNKKYEKVVNYIKILSKPESFDDEKCPHETIKNIMSDAQLILRSIGEVSYDDH